MGIVRTTLALAGYGSLAAAGSFFAVTRKCRLQDVPASDHIFNTTLFARYNPNNAPVTQDVCLRRVPLSNIRPELLESEKKGEGKLVEAFCQGVWGGIGTFARYNIHMTKKTDWDNTRLRLSTPIS